MKQIRRDQLFEIVPFNPKKNHFLLRFLFKKFRSFVVANLNIFPIVCN